MIGLTSQEAARRREKFDLNQIASEWRITLWAVACEEITEPMILLPLGVAVIYSLSGELRDAIAIFLIVTGITLVEV